MSSYHAEIRQEPDGFYLYDMDSSNGTYLAGSKISRVRLGPLQIVALGDKGPQIELELQGLQQPGQDQPSAPADELPKTMLSMNAPVINPPGPAVATPSGPAVATPPGPTVATPSGPAQPTAQPPTGADASQASRAKPAPRPRPDRPRPNRAPAGPPRKPRRWRKILLYVVGLALAVLIGLMALGFYLKSQKVTLPKEVPLVDQGKPVNLKLPKAGGEMNKKEIENELDRYFPKK